jgi:hypothetical protein
MRTVAVSCVKNEIDVIEAFVRHTQAAVDAHLVIDHASTDGTREVLAALVAEGLPLEVRDARGVGYPQGAWLTGLAREAVEAHGADWVVPLDADELLAWPQGAPLVDAPPLLHHVYWRTYVPTVRDDPAERNPVLRLRHRLPKEAQAWAKVVVPAGLVREGGQIQAGSHAVHAGGAAVPSQPLDDRLLLHFPVRTAGQLARKIAIGWLQALLLHGGDGPESSHYKALFAELRDHPDRFAARWREHAHGFAALGAPLPPPAILDPARYRGAPLRHTPATDDQALALSAVLAWADEAARALFRSSSNNPVS